jgi:hypothetical protein
MKRARLARSLVLLSLPALEDRIVWKDFLRGGQTLTIAPDGDYIAVELQVVDEPDLDVDHKYGVYLRRD